MNFSILLLCDLVIYFTIVWKYKVNSLLYQKLYANYTFKLRIHYYLIVSYIHLGILQKDSYIFEIIGRYWKLYIFEYLLVEEKLLNLRSNIAWKQWNKMISLMKIFELVLFSFLLWFEIKWGINNKKTFPCLRYLYSWLSFFSFIIVFLLYKISQSLWQR